MQKAFLILILFVVFGSNGLSQENAYMMNTDSLKKILSITKGMQRINTLNLLAKSIYYRQEGKGFLDSAKPYANEALDIAKKNDYKKGIGNALLTLAMIAIDKEEDYSTTLHLLQTSLPLLKEVKDTASVANCLTVTAKCYHFLGENDKAISFYDSGILLQQQLKDTVSSLWTLLDKAHSYYDQGNFTLSYTAVHDALQRIPKTDTAMLCFAYIRMITLFTGAGLPEIAIGYYYNLRSLHPASNPEQQTNLPWYITWGYRLGGEALLLLKQTDSASRIAKLLNIPLEQQDADDNLFYGHLYAAMGENEKALIYFRQGYAFAEHASHKIALARHAVELAAAYVKLKDFPKAVYYANEAKRVATNIHALLELKNAVGILGDIYAATKNYPAAYRYNQWYRKISDSLAPEEYKRKLSLVQVKDELEIQKQEARVLSSQVQIGQQQIKLQESAIKRRSSLLYFSMAAFFVIAVIVTLVNRNVKLKRKRAELQLTLQQISVQKRVIELEQEKTELEMQALRAQMNPHFIFNCLSSINRFILVNKTEEASDYLTKFSRLIRMVLHHSVKSLITLESELEALRLYLDLERLRFKNAFDYSVTLVNTIDVSVIYISPLLIQPFAENAIWHGLMHKKGIGRLAIEFYAEEKTLICTIIDNGIGRNMADRFQSSVPGKNKSMGVDITAGRLALLNKSRNETSVFMIEDIIDESGTGCGTKVILKMPYRDFPEILS